MTPSETGCRQRPAPARGKAIGPARRPAIAAAIVALALAPLAAHAQPSAADRRQAEALFAEAKKLLAAGQVAEACRKFEGSYKIDPAGGTVLNLALCHEKEGKIATAWAELKEALALAKKANRKDREKIARDRIDAIEPRLPYMLVIPDQPDTEGLAVTVDESSIAREAFGAQIPIDPGAHTAKASAPGREPWESPFEVAEGKKITVRIPALAVSAPVVTATATASAPPEPPPPRYPWMRPAGIAVGSVGVAAAIVGAVFGGRALSLGADAKKECPGNACSQAGLAAVQDGRTSATASDILLGAGAGFAVAGAVLFVVGGLTEPSKPAEGDAEGATSGDRSRPARPSRSAAPSWRLAPLTNVSTTGATFGVEGAW